MPTPKIIADLEAQLATAISIGSTSFTLSAATDDDGVALPTGLYYFTVDNASSNKEYLAGTLTGTSVTGVVSVSRQGVETSGAARAHRVGASVILTDFATYKVYMDQIALVSAPDATVTVKGVAEEATQAEVDAGTATGGTTARLFVNPSTHRGRAYNDYAADAGSTDAYAITVVPAITAYATGQVFTFKANTANTGDATLNVCGLGAKTLKKNATATLETGDIAANQIVLVEYDGTNMQLLSSAINSATPDVQTFNASGTWTKPARGTMAFIQVWGGGGAGNTDGGAGTNGGGGGGGYAERTIPLSSLGATETVTVPAAASAGNAGGTCSFGTWTVAYGGDAGVFNTRGGNGGGSLGTALPASPVTGAGASGANNGGYGLLSGGGGLSFGGNDGVGGSSYYGGAGGGAKAGAGGTSIFGGAGGAGGGAAGGTGTAGTAPGGGGGAGGETGGVGGAGAAGRVTVTVY